MKTLPRISMATGALLVLAATGCRSDYGSGNPYQPGPTAGKAVGAGVGTVAGNVAGAGVGAVQGTTHGFANSFDPQYHMVRYWRTETTADGRTIQVPYDVLVDNTAVPRTCLSTDRKSLPAADGARNECSADDQYKRRRPVT